MAVGLLGTLVMTGMMYIVGPMVGAGAFGAHAGGSMPAAGSLVGHLL